MSFGGGGAGGIRGNLGITSHLVCGNERNATFAAVRGWSVSSLAHFISSPTSRLVVCSQGIIANNAASGSHLLSATATTTTTDPRVRVGGVGGH